MPIDVAKSLHRMQAHLTWNDDNLMREGLATLRREDGTHAVKLLNGVTADCLLPTRLANWFAYCVGQFESVIDRTLGKPIMRRFAGRRLGGWGPNRRLSSVNAKSNPKVILRSEKVELGRLMASLEPPTPTESSVASLHLMQLIYSQTIKRAQLGPLRHDARGTGEPL
jgi:hypothetical protein